MVYPDDEALRVEALAIRTAHDPEHQKDNGYERCALCHFTRHPCDAFDMADQVLTLLNRIAAPAVDPVQIARALAVKATNAADVTVDDLILTLVADVLLISSGAMPIDAYEQGTASAEPS
jgi:hypothetical protein